MRALRPFMTYLRLPTVGANGTAGSEECNEIQCRTTMPPKYRQALANPRRFARQRSSRIPFQFRRTSHRLAHSRNRRSDGCLNGEFTQFFFVNCDPGFVAGVYEALRNFRVVTKRRATSLHLAKALRNGCNQLPGGVAVFAAHEEVEVNREEQCYGCDAKHVCDPQQVFVNQAASTCLRAES